jgi:ectoine hydroxylase
MAGMASDSALVPAAERERFEQDGYLIIRGALTHDEVLYYRKAIDRAYLSAEAQSLVAPGGSLHWLSAVARCPQVVGLADAWGHFPATTPLYGWLKERNLLDPAYPPLRP